jgi:hypothetical protein
MVVPFIMCLHSAAKFGAQLRVVRKRAKVLALKRSMRRATA